MILPTQVTHINWPQRGKIFPPERKRDMIELTRLFRGAAVIALVLCVLADSSCDKPGESTSRPADPMTVGAEGGTVALDAPAATLTA